MGIVDNALIGASGQRGYFLTRSLRLRQSATAYLGRTFTNTGNRQIWTWSGWVKRGALSNGTLFGADGSNYAFIYFNNDSLDCGEVVTTQQWRRMTTQVFRDPSAWYHVVFAFDSTQATAGNRIKLYVNGTQVTAFSTSADPTLNYNSIVNTTIAHSIGSFAAPTRQAYLDGYLTEVNFIDGQALTPSSFGSTNALTGVWQPARYTGSYGTNGFYLPFTDNSALTTSSNVGLGRDYSGNGNYWTTNNISITAGVTYDSMTDVPTLTSATAANFAVLNPIGVPYSTGTASGGNLNWTGASAADKGMAATISMSSGKWYWECVITATAAGGSSYAGIAKTAGSSDTNANKIYIRGDGYLIKYGTSTGPYTTFTTGDIVGIAYDYSAQTLSFYKNNTLNVTVTGVNLEPNLPWVGGYTTTESWSINFGQRPFSYTPPTGFVALNTYNLPTSTIVKGNTVMDATLWTGNSSTQSIVNAAPFKPDFVWIKNRTGANNHALFDSVRGATLRLYSDSTIAEQTEATTLTAFNSNGFSVSSSGAVNASANNYVGWQWQAGQGSSSSNTNGTITSTVSVNASAGFSVVTYTGTGGASATVGHGLGVTPSLIIVKERSSNVSGWNAWTVYHSSIGATGNLVLNTTAATNTAIYAWNNTAPTSSVFTIAYSAGAGVNYTSNYVAYCWTPIAGYSAFGSYTGNGSADGPFVYLGFRPKFVMIKVTSAAQPWIIIDTARNTYNVAGDYLMADSSSAENALSPISTATALDILSNGFKLRNNASSSGYTNASSATYIYMAFAENPFKNALAR